MKKKALVVLLLVVMLVGTFATFSYGAEKKTGLYKEDGQWKYFENGTFKEATGLVQRPDNKTWHYVENGIYKKSTGLVQCVQPGSSKGKWYYVVKGDLDNTATGLVQCVQPGSSKGKWYYVNNGKLNSSTTGLVQCIQPGSSNGKWYYVENGKVNQNAIGMVKCVHPGTSAYGKWYLVYKGKKYNGTGVAMSIQPNDSSYGKWYYIENGKQKKGVTGVFSHGSNGFPIDGGPVFPIANTPKARDEAFGYPGNNFNAKGVYIKNGKWDQTTGVVSIGGKDYPLYRGLYYGTQTPDSMNGFYVKTTQSSSGEVYTLFMIEGGKFKNYTGTVVTKIDGKNVAIEVKSGKATINQKDFFPLKETKEEGYWALQRIILSGQGGKLSTEINTSPVVTNEKLYTEQYGGGI